MDDVNVNIDWIGVFRCDARVRAASASERARD